MSSPPAAATSPPCSSRWPPGTPRALTPSICAGTPSTTAPNSTGCPRCAPLCGWCRRPRAAPHAPRARDPYDAIDHVMTYFFSDPARHGRLPRHWRRRSSAASGNFRCCRRSNAVSTTCNRKSAAPRVKVGADVLPWWPVKGVYLLLERGDAPADAVARRRRCGGRVVGDDTGRRREIGERTGRPVHHVLLPRRRSRSRRRNGCGRC